MKYLEQLWNDYQQKVVPPNASAGQIRQVRLAFYGGAIALWNILMAAPHDQSESKDMAMMKSIHTEINEFIGNLNQQTPLIH
jgi:hypothetical protein